MNDFLNISYIILAVVLICHSPVLAQEVDYNKEKTAIMNVIAKETESYYKEDFNAWKNTYVDTPYFRLYGYWEGFEDKIKFYNGFNSLEEDKKEQFEQGNTLWVGSRIERKDENVRIYPEVAWVTFEEYTYELETDRLRGRSLQTRILEKKDGEWKIAFLGYHFFPE